MTDNAITPARRKLKLTKEEKKELQRRKDIELAVSFFLDLSQDRTIKQMAEEMGTSPATLKRLTQDPYFQEVYDEQLMQLGHHPRLQAMNAQLPDLLPKSYQAMSRLLGPGTAHTAQVAAVKLLWETVKVGDQLQQEDPAAIANFLAAKGVTINNNIMNINLPDEYKDAFQKWMGGDVVNVKAEDVPQLSPTSESTEEKEEPSE